MREKIVTMVVDETYERDVIPLAARGVGSRMLGVEHDNSDWDVRIIFRKPPRAYSGVTGWSDTYDIDCGDIDIHAWDVKKFAGLVSETNPSAIEFLLSDTEYYPDRTEYLRLLEDMIRDQGNRMALYYHYLSLAESNYFKYISSGNDRTKGRSFYVLRATLMSKHIRETNEIPPVNVWEFLSESNSLEDEEVGKLMEFATAKEKGNGSEEIDDEVGEFFRQEEEETMHPTEERTKSPDRDAIDKFLELAISL